jgi:hypothetical protein
MTRMFWYELSLAPHNGSRQRFLAPRFLSATGKYCPLAFIDWRSARNEKPKMAASLDALSPASIP